MTESQLSNLKALAAQRLSADSSRQLVPLLAALAREGGPHAGLLLLLNQCVSHFQDVGGPIDASSEPKVGGLQDALLQCVDALEVGNAALVQESANSFAAAFLALSGEL